MVVSFECNDHCNYEQCSRLLCQKPINSELTSLIYFCVFQIDITDNPQNIKGTVTVQFEYPREYNLKEIRYFVSFDGAY